VDALLPHKSHFSALGGSVLDQETVREYSKMGITYSVFFERRDRIVTVNVIK
jgi:hypothetical protein